MSTARPANAPDLKKKVKLVTLSYPLSKLTINAVPKWCSFPLLESISQCLIKYSLHVT